MPLYDLRTELAIDPIGIDATAPRLSWKLSSNERNVVQAAYRITVESGSEVLWDSGRVESDQNCEVVYRGRTLDAGEIATWRVEVWDNHGGVHASDDATFEAGWTEPWWAEWIGGALVGGPRTSSPAPMVRTSFRIEKPVVRARLYATAGGVYTPSLNYERVGHAELAPGWTEYRKQIRYQTYDVTDAMREGENVLAATLGDGWYCGHVEWRGRQLYGDRPSFYGLLVVWHPDGTTTQVPTDGSWEVAYGSILQADLLMGEHHDARLKFEDWRPVQILPAPGGAVVPQHGPPMRATRTLKPISIIRKPRWPQPDDIVDFGQNLVGRVRLKVKGERGTTIRIRHAEVLDSDGGIYTANLRSALQTDYFTLSGDPDGEFFEPKLTFHGFRYAEVRGYPTELTVDDIEAHVIHSDYDFAGEFECSEPLLNQLFSNIRWGWMGNSLDVPTDCPQRDERLGWTGDAQVFVRTATYVADVETFFEKYQQDLADAQVDGSIPPTAPTTGVVGQDGGPAWADAVVICPWTLYRVYGDRRILERFYPSMRAWMDFLPSTCIDGIRCHPDYKGFHGFGDWLSIDAHTPNDLIGTAMYAYVADLMAKIAKVLGRDSEVAEFESLFADIRQRFQRRYVSPDGYLLASTQTAYLLALKFGLLEESQRANAVQALVDDIGRRGYKLSAGFVGSSYLPGVLADHGRPDIALRLLMQTQWPSWLYAVTQGATTIWERWDGWTHDKGFQDVGMNSFNHYAYGAIGEWMFQRLAGIDLDPEVPGFRKLRMRPILGDFGFVRAAYETRCGRVESEWKVEGESFEWRIQLPPGTTATVEAPENVVDVHLDRQSSARAFEVGSGEYLVTGRVRKG